MSTVLIANGTIGIDFAVEDWQQGLVPALMYEQWANALGVSSTASLESMSGDDVAWAMPLAAPFFPGGPATGMFSSEAAIGFYRQSLSNVTYTQYALGDVSRMFGLASRPTLLLSFHPSGGDLQSLASTKIQRAGSTTLIYGNFKHYSGSNTYRLDVAIKISGGALEVVARSIDAATDLRWIELNEFGGGEELASSLIVSVGIGTMVRLTASLVAPRTDALLQADTPLGRPCGLGALSLDARLLVPSPLAAAGGARALAVLGMEGWLAAPCALGSALALGDVDVSGTLSTRGPLPDLAARAYSDFSTQLAPAPNRYVMDVVVDGVDVRIPISTWQATQQIERACYVQCSVPACAAWVDTILAATEFRISRVGRAVDGSTIEVEMARGPIDHHVFDQGPTNFTATLSGYAPGFTAPDGAPGNGQERALAAVRSISFGGAGLRARAAIDWMLRPGDFASARGRVFRADYINYYVPAMGDAYMDVGERA